MSRNGTLNGAGNLRKLERQAAALQAHNAALKNNIELQNEMKGTTLKNSLFSLVQGAMGGENTTPMGSMTELSYYSNYYPLTLNWTMLTYLYKTHGIIQAAIDMPVLDGMRGGIEIHSDELDADDIKDLLDKLEEDGVFTVVTEAQAWARLYGGSAIVVNTEQDPETPLDMKRLGRVQLYAADRWELSGSDKGQQRFAEFYNFYGQKFHSSRVLTLSGKAAPRLVRQALQGWGMSEAERMVEDLNRYLRTKDVTFELLKEAKLDVWMLKGLNAQLMTAAGTNLTQKRVELMNMFKSYQNALVMDAEDKFEQKQITFAGLADVEKQNMVDIAAALRIPMTKLFGLSASGFNSGEDDIENYNAMVESEVRTPLRPVIRQIINLICFQMFGQEYDIGFKYKPLRVMSSLDEENVNTQKQARYMAQYQAGFMNAQEATGLLNQEKLLPIETEVSKGADPELPLSEQQDDDNFGDDSKKDAA